MFHGAWTYLHRYISAYYRKLLGPDYILNGVMLTYYCTQMYLILAAMLSWGDTEFIVDCKVYLLNFTPAIFISRKSWVQSRLSIICREKRCRKWKGHVGSAENAETWRWSPDSRPSLVAKLSWRKFFRVSLTILVNNLVPICLWFVVALNAY